MNTVHKINKNAIFHRDNSPAPIANQQALSFNVSMIRRPGQSADIDPIQDACAYTISRTDQEKKNWQQLSAVGRDELNESGILQNK